MLAQRRPTPPQEMVPVLPPVFKSTAALKRRKSVEALVKDAVERAAPEGENNAEIVKAIVNLAEGKGWT